MPIHYCDRSCLLFFKVDDYLLEPTYAFNCFSVVLEVTHQSKVEGVWRCSHVRPIKPFMGPRDWDMGVTGRLEHMRSLTCPTDKLTTFYTEKKNVIALVSIPA